jgi:cytochrome c oxidase cbb3-type subunit III
MSTGISIYIIALTVIMIAGIIALLVLTRRMPAPKSEEEKMSHSYDGIEEYNKPLPRWWLWYFYLTIIFSIGYLYLYGGLGAHKGSLNFSQEAQWQQEIDEANAKYQPIFEAYSKLDIPTLAKDHKAIAMGQRIFANTCFGCHGSDAGGTPGYPNLTDNDWLYGKSPASIKQTILQGRNGVMPPLGQNMKPEQLDHLVSYVLSLSGRKFNNLATLEGKKTYDMQCAACHGADGTGNQILGAPNLTDNIWLYGGSFELVKDTIYYGRQGNMPAHKDILGNDKTHVVTAYIYSLSQD